MRDHVNSTLITSDQVNGTEVYGAGGAHVGAIHHLVIDKPSGKIAYAVMGFGGFLGMGQDHYSIPWQSLRYDTTLGGYVTGITQAQLESAPARSENWHNDRKWEEDTYAHYGAPYYWL